MNEEEQALVESLTGRTIILAHWNPTDGDQDPGSADLHLDDGRVIEFSAGGYDGYYTVARRRALEET